MKRLDKGMKCQRATSVSRGVRPQKVLSDFQVFTPVRAFVFLRPNALPPTVICHSEQPQCRQATNQKILKIFKTNFVGTKTFRIFAKHKKEIYNGNFWRIYQTVKNKCKLTNT